MQYNKNLDAVQSHLDEGESIVACFWCSDYKSRVINHTMTERTEGGKSTSGGVFIATEKRVVFYNWRLLGGDDLESFQLAQVSAIEITQSPFGDRPKIHMKVSGNDVEIVPNRHYSETFGGGGYEKVVAYVRDHMGETSAPQAAPQAAADDIPAQIQKLASLKDAGILTEEEFATKKAELLAKM